MNPRFHPANRPVFRACLLSLALVAGLAGTGCAQLLQRAAEVDAKPVAPVQLTADEQALLADTNAFRKENGLDALLPDARLVAIARLRAQDMAARHYFSHQTPEGEDVFTIMRDQHVNFWAAGENLARNNYPADLAPGEAMDGWRKSPEHRANLLHPAFGHLGVGVARAADGKRYFAQVFTD